MTNQPIRITPEYSAAKSIVADFTVEHATWDRDLADLREVREEVFVIEQQVSREEEWDELDALSHHVLARANNGEPIGTGRLTPERKIGRMAVRMPWRGKQVGATLLRTLVERARELGYADVELHSQVSAIGFYEAFGFASYGEEFVEANIRHRHMRLALAPMTAPERAPPAPAPLNHDYHTTTRDETIATFRALLQGAARDIAICSRELDPGLLDHTDILAALQHLGTQGRSARVRILVRDPDRAMHDGNRLITLAQRLSSVFEIRVPEFAEDRHYTPAFLLTDRSGYLFRPDALRYEGEGGSYAPGRHRQLLSYFEQVWERARSADELRQLSL
jgi:predicted GNAT family N-acyltransferase